MTGLRQVLFCLLLASCLNAGATDRYWNFSVLLNGEPIGNHDYTLTGSRGSHQVRSEASMRVNFLFIEAFRYTHRAEETWRDGCLHSIESETDNNRQQLKVSGRREQNLFRVEATGGSAAWPGCVISFAYWDLALLLNAGYLLNSQTGERVPVTITHVGSEQIEAAASLWQAERYSLTGENISIDLWYGPGDEWLALRSTLNNGRILEYRLLDGHLGRTAVDTAGLGDPAATGGL